MSIIVISLIFPASAALFFAGRALALRQARHAGGRLHSRPVYHGLFLAISGVAPAIIILSAGILLAPLWTDARISAQIENAAPGLTKLEIATLLRVAKGENIPFASTNSAASEQLIAKASANYKTRHGNALLASGIMTLLVFILSAYWGIRKISLRFRARPAVESVIRALLMAASAVAIITTFGIVLSLTFESLRFFQKVNVLDFIFGLHWSPQSEFEGAGAEAKAANSQVFGAIPLLAGTALITLIAILVAAPIGLFSAIYLSDYASRRTRATAKPVLEILAGIPTVVYGFFAALALAPGLRKAGSEFGVSIASESALAAGIVMGIMIIPFISSLSDDVINAVPRSLREGSAGLGATKSETMRKVVLPAALPGIVSALILAISRAVGETMIVVMAAGLAANLTANPFQAVTTVTVQIVTLLVGDQEFDSAKTLAAFALGLLLFVVTLGLNIIALLVVRRYREQYD